MQGYDEKTGERGIMKNELTTILAHELVHEWRELKGKDKSEDLVHWFLNDKGQRQREGWYLGTDNELYGDLEEFRTVGIGNKNANDFRKIDIRGDYN